ncbi:peptidase M16 domain protein [Isosphaera pallida ATCC 43644]|uniref:Peptidase M16 domain protein n=1 Tax=Isosphaera pallida (strain ATCC 43644 / DSM 9630 / IS1B) TaxID=575540 RepID=E8R6P6_ISOPI|nr:pitrilysin family protein [Isosphaera pallida]ADV63948.1 peptidase M16 domain protein [Isosphaera pallida ATCC 43644]
MKTPHTGPRASTPPAAGGSSSRFHHATLPNGLEVVAELGPTYHSVAAGFFVKTGSRDESPETAGVSHFLEHMAFKGGGKRDALAVNRDFDRVGALHNAQTSEEDTIYYAACLPEYLPDTLDILAELMRPALREEDFQTEKLVILEEIKMYLDDPMMTAYEAAKAAHFGAHPLGRSILGTVESIEALTLHQMRAYHAQRYGPGNVVLAFAGKDDWSRLLDLAHAACGSWQGNAGVRATPPCKGLHRFEAIERPDDQQQKVVAVMDAPALESDQRHAASLMAAMLGDQTGSRLYWELVDPGHADYAEASYQEFNQAGAFYVFMSCQPDTAQEQIHRLAAVLSRVMADGFTAEELQRAKNKVMSRLVLRGERPMGRLMSVGTYWTYLRRHVPVQDEIDAFNRVQLEDVRRVLDEWPPLPMTLVTIGPNTQLVPPA